MKTKMTKEQFLEYGRNLPEMDKKELINYWLSYPENGYLGGFSSKDNGVEYGKPNTSDKSILIEKCTIDLPWASPEEIEDIVEAILN